MKRIKEKIKGIEVVLNGLYDGGDVTEAARSTLQFAINEAMNILKEDERIKDCGIIHYTDWNGKCFNCGKQIFERHTH